MNPPGTKLTRKRRGSASARQLESGTGAQADHSRGSASYFSNAEHRNSACCMCCGVEFCRHGWGCCTSRSSSAPSRQSSTADDASVATSVDADIEGEDSCPSRMSAILKAAFCGSSPTFTVMLLFLGIVAGIVGLALQASFSASQTSDASSSLRLTISTEVTFAWNLLYAIAIAIGVYPIANAANYIFLGTLRQLLFSRFFVVVLYVGAFDNGPLTTIIWAVSASELAPRLAGLPSLGSLGTRLLVLFLVIGLVTGLKNLMVAVLQGRTILDQFTAKVRDAVQQLVVLQNLSAAAVEVATKRARLLKRFHAAQQQAREAGAASGSDSASPGRQHAAGAHTAVHVPVADLDDENLQSLELPVSMPLARGGSAQHAEGSPQLVHATPPLAPAAAFSSGQPVDFLHYVPQATRVGLNSSNTSHASMSSRPAPGSNLLQSQVGDPHGLPPLMEELSDAGSSPVRRSTRAPTLQEGELLAVVGEDGLLCTVRLQASVDLGAAAGLSTTDGDGDSAEDSGSLIHSNFERHGMTVSIMPTAREHGDGNSPPAHAGAGMGTGEEYTASSTHSTPSRAGMPMGDGALGWLPPVSAPPTSARQQDGADGNLGTGPHAQTSTGMLAALKVGGHILAARSRQDSSSNQAQQEDMLFQSGSQSPDDEPDVADLRDFESEEENYAVLSQYIEAGHFSLFDGKGRIVAIRNAAHAKRIVSGLFSALDIQNAGKIVREQLTWAGDGWSEPLGPGWSDESVEGAFAGIGADNALSFSRSDLLLFTEAAVTGFQSLRGTLNSFTAVTRALDMIADAVLFFVFIIFGVLLFDIDVQPVLISIGTVLVSLGFAISGPASNVVESLIFLLVTRPYELGDRVRFDSGPPLYVRKIDLYTTTFERLDGTHATYRNALLASKEMRNEKRSGYAVVAVVLDIALDATPAQLEALNGAVVGYVRDRPMSWRSGIIEFYVYSIHPERNSMTVAFWLKHRLPYQQCVTVFADVGSFLLFVASTLRSLHVDYRMPKQPIEIVGGEGGHLTGQRWAPDAPDHNTGMAGPTPLASLLSGSHGAGSNGGGSGLPLRPSGTPPLNMARQPPPFVATAPQGTPWASQGLPSGIMPTHSASYEHQPVQLHQFQAPAPTFSQGAPVASSLGLQYPAQQMPAYSSTAYAQLPYHFPQYIAEPYPLAGPQFALPPFPSLPAMHGQPGSVLPVPVRHPAQLVAAEHATRQWRDIRTGSIAHLWRPEQRSFVPVVSAAMLSPSAGESGEGVTPVPQLGAAHPTQVPQGNIHAPVMWSASWPLQVQLGPVGLPSGVQQQQQQQAGPALPTAMFGPVPLQPRVTHSAPMGPSSGMTKSASAGSMGSDGHNSTGARRGHPLTAPASRNVSDSDLAAVAQRSVGSGSVAIHGGERATGKHRRIELTHTVGNFGGIQLKPHSERQRAQLEKNKARLKAAAAAKPSKGKRGGVASAAAAGGGDSASVGTGGSLGRGDSIFGRSRSWGKDSQATAGSGKPRNKSVLWALRQGETSGDTAASTQAARSTSLSSHPMQGSRSNDNLAQLAGTLSPDDGDDSKST